MGSNLHSRVHERRCKHTRRCNSIRLYIFVGDNKTQGSAFSRSKRRRSVSILIFFSSRFIRLIRQDVHCRLYCITLCLYRSNSDYIVSYFYIICMHIYLSHAICDRNVLRVIYSHIGFARRSYTCVHPPTIPTHTHVQKRKLTLAFKFGEFVL